MTTYTIVLVPDHFASIDFICYGLSALIKLTEGVHSKCDKYGKTSQTSEYEQIPVAFVIHKLLPP
jgi:hypothetical protein